MNTVDSVLVLNKLSFMDRYLTYLEEYKFLTFEEYNASFEFQFTVERIIQLIIQVGIDVNYYLLKKLQIPRPEQTIDSPLKLAEVGIIDQQLANYLSESIKLRNRLVHLYEDINPKSVHTAIHEVLRDYSRYQKSILEYLDQLDQQNDETESP